jgi:hypothetical protein
LVHHVDADGDLAAGRRARRRGDRPDRDGDLADDGRIADRRIASGARARDERDEGEDGRGREEG